MLRHAEHALRGCRSACFVHRPQPYTSTHAAASFEPQGSFGFGEQVTQPATGTAATAGCPAALYLARTVTLSMRRPRAPAHAVFPSASDMRAPAPAASDCPRPSGGAAWQQTAAAAMAIGHQPKRNSRPTCRRTRHQRQQLQPLPLQWPLTLPLFPATAAMRTGAGTTQCTARSWSRCRRRARSNPPGGASATIPCRCAGGPGLAALAAKHLGALMLAWTAEQWNVAPPTHTHTCAYSAAWPENPPCMLPGLPARLPCLPARPAFPARSAAWPRCWRAGRLTTRSLAWCCWTWRWY